MPEQTLQYLICKKLRRSRFALFAIPYQDEVTCDRFRQQFVSCGVDLDRIIFEPPSFQIEDFFQAHERIDCLMLLKRKIKQIKNHGK